MARFATDSERELFAELSGTISARLPRNRKRSAYAEADAKDHQWRYLLPDGRIVEPPAMHWPSKAIEVFSARLATDFFRMDDASLLGDFEAAYDDMDGEFVESQAIRSALRHGPSFVFTSVGMDGEPGIVSTVQPATRATAKLDPRTRRVVAALELLDSRRANMYLPYVVLHLDRRPGRLIVLEEWDTGTGRVLCAPYVHGVETERPFGSSRITNSVMDFTDAAVRTFMRQEVSADWYSYPRERAMGVDPEMFEADGDMPVGVKGGLVRTIGGVQGIPDIHPDDEPLIPDSLRRAQFHTLPQMTMQPFSDQFRLIAAQFSGASSIPLQYLGIVADSNPTSAAAVAAQDIDLVRAVKGEWPNLKMGRREFARNVLVAMHGDEVLSHVRGLDPVFVEPRVRSLTEEGQYVALQVQAGNFPAGAIETLEQLPISREDARRLAEAKRRDQGSTVLAELRKAASIPVAATAGGADEEL